MIAELAVLQELGFIVLAAAACVFAAQLLRIPSIVAYILAGLLLGPVFQVVTVTETIDLIAEVGIALLLFLVGLELSLDKIRDVGKVAAVAGLGQVVFTAAGGLGFSLLLGFELVEGIFIATALTFSSTVVVVKLLTQKGELDSTYGRIAVGIFLVQDLVVVLALTVLAGLGRQAEGSPADLAVDLALAFGGMGVLLLVAAVAARFVLPLLLGWVASSQETLLVWSLAWCFLLVLGAELMHLSLEIGAFLAGISIAQLPYNDDLRRRVHPLMNFFIAVFFVALGIRMEFGSIGAIWLPALLLSVFVLVAKPPIFMLIISRMGYGERTSFLTSVTVAQISEFSFIFAAMGLSAGLIEEDMLSLIGIVGLATIAVSSYMILYNHRLYEVLHRWNVLAPFRAGGREEPEEKVPERSGHILVVGMNSAGRRIASELHERGWNVLAVDTDPIKLSGLPCDTLHGNVEYLAVLEEAGLEHARLLVSALHIEEVNRLLAYRASRAGVPSAINSFDPATTEDLRRLGVTHLIESQRRGVERFAQVLRDHGVFQG